MSREAGGGRGGVKKQGLVVEMDGPCVQEREGAGAILAGPGRPSQTQGLQSRGKTQLDKGSLAACLSGSLATND